jgi:hypothetical protein
LGLAQLRQLEGFNNKRRELVAHYFKVFATDPPCALPARAYPALRAKDVVLKLQQDHSTDISDDKQPELASAVQRVTLSAWQIDSAGDLGNKEEIAVLYDVFHTAVGEILGLYGATH